MYIFCKLNSIQFGEKNVLEPHRALRHLDGSVQVCSNPLSALAMELLQSCTKPSIYKLEAILSRPLCVSSTTPGWSGTSLQHFDWPALFGQVIFVYMLTDVCSRKQEGCDKPMAGM